MSRDNHSISLLTERAIIKWPPGYKDFAPLEQGQLDHESAGPVARPFARFCSGASCRYSFAKPNSFFVEA